MMILPTIRMTAKMAHALIPGGLLHEIEGAPCHPGTCFTVYVECTDKVLVCHWKRVRETEQ